MFNAEHLLGGLVQGMLNQSTGRRSRHRSNQNAIGMGLIGLAIGAYEHYNKQQRAQPSYQSAPPSPAAAPMPPPAPGFAPPPPPQDAAAMNADDRQQHAMLLIRAMISAAAADSVIDAVERQKILTKVTAAGLGEQAETFLENEMSRPLSLISLLGEARKLGASDELSSQIYLAALLAIDVDAPAEAHYLSELATGLGLSDAQTKDIRAQLGYTD